MSEDGRCESRHVVVGFMSIPLRCLHPVGHEGAHHVWIGTAQSHDVYWDDEGNEFDDVRGYHDEVKLQ